MNIHKLLIASALAIGLSACGGDEKPDDPATATPPTGAASTAPADVASTAPADVASTAPPASQPPAPPATNPPPVPIPVVTATPEVQPTLAPGNRCREVETTDWTARVQGGVLKVSAKAHLRSGGWKLTIADRGLTRDRPGKQLLELVAEKPTGPATLPVGIRPIEFAKPAPANINRIEARCGPNRIVLVRL